jgi:two-component system chemotaxis response regulator CheB
MVVAQHMPALFTGAFARRLDTLCACAVTEARDGDELVDGRVLIAPGGRHLLVRRSGARLFAEVTDGPLVSRHRPSVDVLFQSAAGAAGPGTLAALLTGMGHDGAQGLKDLRTAGATTIAEDESTCIVYGMPRVAVELGGAELVLPLPRIAELLRLRALSHSSRKETSC